MMNNILIKYTSYINKFKCLGSKCNDNCCKNWQVYIDKSTFDKYEKLKNTKDRKLILDNIITNKKNSAEYGIIKMNNTCPFLNSKGLCWIQCKYGEDYLSNVCRTYPRIINKIGNVYEVSLDMSCYEAAKIILLNKNNIILQEKYEDNLIYYDNNISMEININEVDIGSNYKYLVEIRDKSISILQNNHNCFNKRLYILGLFLERVKDIICYETEQASDLIKSYEEKLYFENNIKDEITYLLQLSFFKIIFNEILLDINDIEYDYKSLIMTIYGIYNFEINKEIFNRGRFYFQAYNKCEKEIFEKYEYILINYCQSYTFSNLFPFMENDILYDGYILLLFRIAFIKLCISALYIEGEQIEENNIVKIVQVITKEIDHRSNVSKKILSFLRINNLDNKIIANILL